MKGETTVSLSQDCHETDSGGVLYTPCLVSLSCFSKKLKKRGLKCLADGVTLSAPKSEGVKDESSYLL